MMKIVTIPNPVLTTPTQRVKTITPKLRSLVEEMKKTLIAQRDPEGVGLAATQVGESISIFIMRPTTTGEITVHINPEITSLPSDEVVAVSQTLQKRKSKEGKMEGCLSIPHIWAPLRRKSKVELRSMDINGEAHTEVYEGFEAIIVQHEVDHLNGILFTQRCLEQGTQLYEEDGDELVKMKA